MSPQADPGGAVGEIAGASGYAWWTIQLDLDDGARILVWLMSTDYTDLSRNSGPTIAVMAELPDGRRAIERVEHARGSYIVDPDSDGVRMGSSSLERTPDGYRVTVEVGEFAFSGVVHPQVPAWKPGIVLPPDYGWSVLVPFGTVEGEYSLGGARTRARGSAFIDHDWGRTAVEELFDHCWWGRGRVGDVAFVTVTMVPRQRHGSEPRSLVHLAGPEGPLFLDPADVTFKADTRADPVTGRDIPGSLVYTHEGESGRIALGFHSEEMIYRGTAADQTVGIGGLTAALVGRDGAYYRFFGASSLEQSGRGAAGVRTTADATWELIYFPGLLHDSAVSDLR